ncbi:hypothetical protein ACKAV7_014686 [Fusarium commune]
MRLTVISTAVFAAFASVALSAPAPAPTNGPDTELTAPQRLETTGQEQVDPDLVGYHPDRLAAKGTTVEIPAWVKNSNDENAAAGGRGEEGRQEEDNKQEEGRMLSKRGSTKDCVKDKRS